MILFKGQLVKRHILMNVYVPLLGRSYVHVCFELISNYINTAFMNQLITVIHSFFIYHKQAE